MSLTDLINNVVIITNRPDLVAETTYAIKTATLKAHFADQWKRDIVETTITPLTSVSLTDSRYVFDVTAAPFVRFRQLIYARETPNTNPNSFSWDNGNSSPYNVHQYELIEADSIFDEYNRMLANTVYMSGNSLKIRTSYPPTSIDIGYYANPLITSDPVTFSSWIANEYAYIIEQEAASAVFKMIGKDEEYQRFAALWQESIQTLRTNLLP